MKDGATSGNRRKNASDSFISQFTRGLVLISLLVASLCKADTYKFYKKNSLFMLPQSCPLAYKTGDPNWNHWS